MEWFFWITRLVAGRVCWLCCSRQGLLIVFAARRECIAEFFVHQFFKLICVVLLCSFFSHFRPHCCFRLGRFCDGNSVMYTHIEDVNSEPCPFMQTCTVITAEWKRRVVYKKTQKNTDGCWTLKLIKCIIVQTEVCKIVRVFPKSCRQKRTSVDRKHLLEFRNWYKKEEQQNIINKYCWIMDQTTEMTGK